MDQNKNTQGQQGQGHRGHERPEPPSGVVMARGVGIPVQAGFGGGAGPGHRQPRPASFHDDR